MPKSIQQPSPSSWRRSPTQDRSRAAEKRLARAARELLADRSYSEVRVDDVARRAGVSVGGFYGRFKGKAALLHLADIDFLDACRDAFDEEVPEDTVGTPEEILLSFVTVMVGEFRRHRTAILQAWRHAGPDDAVGFRARAEAFNEHVHGRIRRLLGACHSEIGHPDPETAINLTIFFVSSAARDAVLRGSLDAYPISLSESELVAEIVRAGTLYLTGTKP